MLCRSCGRSEREHAFLSCQFSAGGRVGHDTANTAQYGQAGISGVLNIPTVFKVEVNPKFNSALEKMKQIHDKKSQDYANDANRYQNFEEAAATAGCSVDTVFAVLIGVKLARLRELLKSNKEAQNESIQDSRLDLAVYATLWLSYHE